MKVQSIISSILDHYIYVISNTLHSLILLRNRYQTKITTIRNNYYDSDMKELLQ